MLSVIVTIQKYNICIEWDEKGHQYREEYDINREDFLKSHNNCKIIRINEDEFLSNITIGIEKSYISNRIIILIF